MPTWGSEAQLARGGTYGSDVAQKLGDDLELVVGEKGVAGPVQPVGQDRVAR